jgi:hypothetical protein
MAASQTLTRGGYERQAAQPKNEKDGTEGYSKNPGDPTHLDPQTYCITTPGRNAIIMQDDPKYARLRLKTAEGHQIIFDDANERIYVSTAMGKTWIELDQDGHVHVFGAASVSIRAGADINLTADGDINLEAGKGVHVKARGGDIRLNTSNSFHVLATANIIQSACGIYDVNAGGAITATGSTISLNGAAASCAETPQAPTVVPGHEPWTRPVSKQKRNSYWKE